MVTKSEEEPKARSKAKEQKPEVRFVRGPDGNPVPVEKKES